MVRVIHHPRAQLHAGERTTRGSHIPDTLLAQPGLVRDFADAQQLRNGGCHSVRHASLPVRGQGPQRREFNSACMYRKADKVFEKRIDLKFAGPTRFPSVLCGGTLYEENQKLSADIRSYPLTASPASQQIFLLDRFVARLSADRATSSRPSRIASSLQVWRPPPHLLDVLRTKRVPHCL
jgi:hypothetical protein